MDLRRYVAAVLRSWWLVVLLAAAGGVFSFASTAAQRPVYESTVTVLLNPASPSDLVPYLNQTVGGGSAAALPGIVAAYTEYLRSRSFTELASDRLQVGPPIKIARSLRAVLVPNTNILALTVQWDNPVDAAKVANGLAQVFVSERRSAPSQQDLEITQSAEYYRARVEQLRRQYDQLAESESLSDDDKVQGLLRVDALLTPAEANYQRWSQAAAARQAGPATILDLALQPPGPVGSRRARVLMFGIAAGLALGLVAALLLERLQGLVRSVYDAARVTRARPLASIPFVVTEGGQAPVLTGNGVAEYAGRGQPATEKLKAYREAYGFLRANLLFASGAALRRTVLVTSPCPREGKSLVAANLAVSLAQAGQSVILVDANLRQPSQHLLWGTPSDRGLSTLLAERRETANGSSPTEHLGSMDSGAALLRDSAVPGLRLLPAGPVPPNPAELQQSRAFSEILAALDAETIVLDGHHLLGTADAAILAGLVDAVILVVEPGATRTDDLERAASLLERAAAPLVGVVANKRRGHERIDVSTHDQNVWQAESWMHPSHEDEAPRRVVERLPAVPTRRDPLDVPVFKYR